MSSRAHAISMPGSDLSQPAIVTSASNCSAFTISSTESAMISRLTSEDFMPSVPMEMPSETAIVPNSSGTAPAWRMPSFAAAARPFRCTLQGVTSFQDDATATCGRSRSSSDSPTARSIARAAARDGPVVSGPDRGRGKLGLAGRELALSDIRPPPKSSLGRAAQRLLASRPERPRHRSAPPTRRSRCRRTRRPSSTPRQRRPRSA